MRTLIVSDLHLGARTRRDVLRRAEFCAPLLAEVERADRVVLLGDVVELRDKARAMIVVRHNLDTIDRQTPQWLENGDGGYQATVRDLPMREQIDVPVREQLIVELYSK